MAVDNTPSPTGLAAALSAFQAEAPTFPKSKTAKVKSKRTGAEYTYTYAALGDILPIVGPLLAKHGLAWSAKPGISDTGDLVLNYALLYMSGEVDAGVMPLGVDRNCAPQELGSAITYARRYALTAQLNLATEEDDDGKAAQDSKATSVKAPAKPAQQPKADKPKDTEPMITGPQSGLLHARCSELRISEETRHALVHCITGQPHSDRIPRRLLGHDGAGDKPRQGILGVLAACKESQITSEQLHDELRRAYAANGNQPLDENVAGLILSIPDAAIPFA
jgi:ERF superfamily protein